KITSSTSMTSISGIMLISASGASELALFRIGNAMSRHPRRRGRAFAGLAARRAGGQRLARRDRAHEAVGKALEARERHAVRAHQRVVADHGVYRHGEPERRHDERLAHGFLHLVERALTR